MMLVRLSRPTVRRFFICTDTDSHFMLVTPVWPKVGKLRYRSNFGKKRKRDERESEKLEKGVSEEVTKQIYIFEVGNISASLKINDVIH